MQYSVSLLHEVLTVVAWIVMLLLSYRETGIYNRLYADFTKRKNTSSTSPVHSGIGCSS